MKNYGLNELREMFLQFYEERGHLRLASYPLVPHNDASLLLINSGMAPMKLWFTGEQEPPNKRVTTCQKCIRTGDIENVGKTSRHGTYFEMLGNFSFGDYFKEEAIAWYWEFLTKRIGIDESLLYPSVYEEDDEAYNIWRDKIGISPERIFKLGKEDNYWDVGAGPCGPCSEVYFDRGDSKGCGNPKCAPGCECDRFIELGNNVFTQFSNDGEDNYTELKQKNIDFGGGLERLAIVVQGVESLFEVDTMMNIIRSVSKLSGVQYNTDEKTDISLRVITDHIRAATMMICDGILPSNEGRGYILRRLLRRAARHGRILGMDKAFLFEISDIVIKENESAYPDLREKAEYIARVIRAEEENFGKTIDSGMQILTSLIEKSKEKGEKTLNGEDMFKLYDTYGFPRDMTLEILAEHDMDADEQIFSELMEAQRVRARKAREELGDIGWAGLDLGAEIAATEFVGFTQSSAESKILALISQGESVSRVTQGSEAIVVLDKSPFYAEMGGQVADVGFIKSKDGALFEVRDVQVRADRYLHSGIMRAKELSLTEKVTAEIDEIHRDAVARAHTATHILHCCLQSVLGEHAHQAGSLVEPDKLRFDFTHFSALTAEELSDIEAQVNDVILKGLTISCNEMSFDNAKKLGAAALFGEKYGDIVRVVSIGDEFSHELCGGTHLENSAKIGAFNLISEFSVASGVRRIEAITGKATLNLMSENKSRMAKISAMLSAGTADEIIHKLEANFTIIKELRSKLEQVQSKESQDLASQYMSAVKDVKSLKLLIADVEAEDADGLRQIADKIRDIAKSNKTDSAMVAVLTLAKDDKVSIVVTCGSDAIAKGVKAGELIGEIARQSDGRGGGKADFAMGGCKDVSKLRSALGIVEKYIEERA